MAVYLTPGMLFFRTALLFPEAVSPQEEPAPPQSPPFRVPACASIPPSGRNRFAALQVGRRRVGFQLHRRHSMFGKSLLRSIFRKDKNVSLMHSTANLECNRKTHPAFALPLAGYVNLSSCQTSCPPARGTGGIKQ